MTQFSKTILEKEIKLLEKNYEIIKLKLATDPSLFTICTQIYSTICQLELVLKYESISLPDNSQLPFLPKPNGQYVDDGYGCVDWEYYLDDEEDEKIKVLK